MSAAGDSEGKAKRRYISLKNLLAINYLSENVSNNLVVFRQTCAGHFKGPGQYMNLPFYDICTHLESKGILSYKNLTALKDIVIQLPIEATEMEEAVSAAQRDINEILAGGTAQPPSGTHKALAPARPATDVRDDPGEGFHQRESHAVCYDDLESMIRLNMRNSIGFIKVDDVCGTGFRVGECYVMTAYHVFEDEFEFLCKFLKEMVEQSALSTTDIRGILATLSDQFKEDNGLDLKTCVDRFLKTSKKQLRFATLACHLDKSCHDHSGASFLERIENRWRTKTWIGFNMGTEEEHRFGLCLDIPFADKANDILILKLRIDNENQARIPPPLHLERFSIRNKIHLIGYLKHSSSKKSLHVNTNCQVYCDSRQLSSDINEAMSWWKVNLPGAALDPCRYANGDDETASGRTILHASKEFEKRSSGCPGVVFDDTTARQLVVEVMYLSGYPTKHFETGKVHSPPLQYCFESGVSTKNIAKILLKADQEDLMKAIFN